MRNNQWLKNQLNLLLKKYFGDVIVSNPVEIKFGREAKYRFGSIRLIKPRRSRIVYRLPILDRNNRNKPSKSIITITSMFAKESVPVNVVHYTICHELCHFAHGFSSTNKRLFKFPHHGGIVNKELAQRGAQDLSAAFKQWLKNYRQQILKGKIRI